MFRNTPILVVLFALSVGVALPVSRAADEIFVSNYAAGTITVYPRLTNGDAAPLRTIHQGLRSPHTMGVDPIHQELFIPNNNTPDENPAINVYDLTEGFPGGTDDPKRTIAGPHTQLNRPAGLVLDLVHREIYVANDLNQSTTAGILVFPMGADGDVPPTRVIRGPQTSILGPLGLALDLVHDELVVVSYKTADGGSISTFPRTASGDVPPLRTIQGPLTGFKLVQNVAIDFARDEMILTNSFFDSPASLGEILFFPRLATGNLAPTRKIAGPNTSLCNPIGLFFDTLHDEVVVSNSAASGTACGRSVATFAATAVGDVPPLRKVGPGPLCALNNSEGVAVTTTLDCSDPLVLSGTPCDDGNVCTLNDTCGGGVCRSGAGVTTCGDTDICTVDSCTPAAGCTHTVQDLDSDGHCDAQDCAPNDPGAFAFAPEVNGLVAGADKTTLNWNSVSAFAGTGTSYALLRGSITSYLFGSGPSETCLASVLLSPTTADATVPDPDGGFWYLVRGHNSCGAGSYGIASDLSERISSSCP